MKKVLVFVIITYANLGFAIKTHLNIVNNTGGKIQISVNDSNNLYCLQPVYVHKTLCDAWGGVTLYPGQRVTNILVLQAKSPSVAFFKAHKLGLNFIQEDVTPRKKFAYVGIWNSETKCAVNYPRNETTNQQLSCVEYRPFSPGVFYSSSEKMNIATDVGHDVSAELDWCAANNFCPPSALQATITINAVD